MKWKCFLLKSEHTIWNKRGRGKDLSIFRIKGVFGEAKEQLFLRSSNVSLLL